MDNLTNIGFCNGCRRFSMDDPSTESGSCSFCGGSDVLRQIQSPHFDKTSSPIPIPQRLESTRLTPNDRYPSGHGSEGNDRACFMFMAVGHGLSPADVAGTDDIDGDEEYNLAVQASIADAQSPEPNPADPGLLESMPRFVFGRGNIPNVPTSCYICMEDFEDGEDLVETACCKNVTHLSCMENTLCVISACPFCRHR